MKKGKRFLSLLLSLCLTLGLLPGMALAAEGGLPFADVKAGDWYYEAVQYVYEKGMMSGVSDTAFAPGDSTTRGMIVTVLHRLEKQPETVATGKFPDVAADQWYAGPVAWASEKSIVNGYDNGNFGPMDPITREQMAAILYRYAQFKGYDTKSSGDISAFADSAQVSSYAVEAMKWAVGQGLISGMENNMLAPQGNATRGQIAVVLMRYDQKVAGGQTENPTTPAQPGATTPSGGGSVGGGGGSGGGGSVTPAVASVTLSADKTAEGSSATVPVGAKITASISNPNSATVVWLVGGAETQVENNSYTVTVSDLGKEIQVKLVKEDGTDEASSNKFTVEKSAEVDVANESSPVQIDLQSGETKVYTIVKDEDGNDKREEVAVGAGDKLILSIEPKAVSAEDAKKITDNDGAKNILVSAVEAAMEQPLSAEGKEKLAEATAVVAVDVDLTLVQTEGEQTTETEIHPVGETTVTLSAAQLNLAGKDLRLYHFNANHTNVEGVVQNIPGVVKEDGTAVTFKTNGLSTIWIGNVPPRTVTFDTKGGSAVAPQTVRFGSTVDTGKVGTPTKAGSLFCGWTYDLAKTPIIYDLTVEAKWTEGAPMPNSQFTVQISNSDHLEFANDVPGKYTIKAKPDAAYAANITAVAVVKPYANATQYVISASAETAANTTDPEQFVQVEGSDDIPMKNDIPVTNSEGKIVAGKTSYYIKWMDANGDVLALQELIIVVDNGQGAADKMVITREINRGVGTYTPYLTSSAKEDAPKWVGYINGDPQRQYTNNSSERKYHLRTNVSFQLHFNGAEYNYTDYDVFHMEFKPFEGESYADKTVKAQAAYYDRDSHRQETVDASAEVNRETGRLEVSIPLSALNEPASSSWINFTMKVTAGDVTQEIHVDTRNPKYQNAIRDTKHETATDMTELRGLLDQAKTEPSIYWYISYTGKEDILLTDSLTIPSNVHIDFNSCAVTVGAGGVLTMESGEDRASSIYLNEMSKSFTVANGGKLVAFDTRGENQDRTFAISVAAVYINVEQNGAVEIKPHTSLQFDGFHYENSSTSSACTLSEGSKVTLTGSDKDGAHLGIYNFENVSLDGAIDSGNYCNLYIHSDTILVSGGIQAASTIWNNVEFYGDVTVTEKGKIQVSGQETNLNLQCPLTNKGAITLENGAYGIFTNTGFAQHNSGTISIGSDCAVNLEGTKMVNTGSITGSGQIYAMLGDDCTDYAANHTGLKYVEIEPGTTAGPDNYSRYMFDGEPDKTIDVTLYKGEISNEQGGSLDSALQVQTENFPEK
ncbi:MAG: hypothetical protein HFE80_00240 [Clostridiaceae bacterium]|jgi:hypothetical protein|nr:hypothetical protein [Clostridiaceae bacterium]